MSDVAEKPQEAESIVIPDPDPANKIEVYLHSVISMLGVMIGQQNDLITVFTRASEPELAKKNTVRLLNGTEIEVR